MFCVAEALIKKHCQKRHKLKSLAAHGVAQQLVISVVVSIYKAVWSALSLRASQQIFLGVVSFNASANIS